MQRSVKWAPLGVLVSWVSLWGCVIETQDTSTDPETAEVQSELACTTNLVPTMTSPSTPSGLVTRSGVYDSSYEAWRAFDSSNTTMWISGVFQTPAWIAYQWFDGPRTVARYAINFVNGSLTSRAPRDWTFEGWNGGSWNVLDTRTAQTGWLGTERREYTVTYPGSYSQYRLNMSDDNDVRSGVVVVSMGSLELIGCPAAPPCGDGICQSGETAWSCRADCGYCGDGVCYGDEDASWCSDCGGGGGGGCLVYPCPIP